MYSPAVARRRSARILTAARFRPTRVRPASGLPVAVSAVQCSGKLSGAALGFLPGRFIGASRCCSDDIWSEPLSRVGPKFEFCGKPQTFTPVFPASPTKNTASVNAGDYNLSVGSVGINRAFQQALSLNANNGYQQLHEAILKKAAAMPWLAGDPPAELGLACCSALARNVAKGPIGAAFIHVFTLASRPFSERNVAMLYVVGPRGAGGQGGHRATIMDREVFLEAVRETAKNAIEAVCIYNHEVGEYIVTLLEEPPHMPLIQEVQWCLVSGGANRHPATSKFDVAAATVEGMSRPMEFGWCAPDVRFTYDEGVFELAVAQKQRRL